MDVAVGRRVALLATAGADFTVRLWNPEKGVLLKTLPTGSLSPWGVALSPDDGMVTVSSVDGKVQTWEIATGKRIQGFSYGPTTIAWGVAYHPSGRLLATSTREGHLDLWEVGTWKPVWRQKLPVGVNRIQFRPDGAELAVSTFRGSRIVETRTGRTLRRLRRYDIEVNSTVYSPDGRRIATGADDRTVRLWDATSGRAIWRAPALLDHPLRLLTHRGWQDITTDAGQPRPARTDRERHLVENAELVDGDAVGRGICVATWDDHVERWSGPRLDWRVPMKDVRALQMTPSGCLVLAGGQARLVTPSAGAAPRAQPTPAVARAEVRAATREVTLALEALAIAADGEGLLVATQQGVRSFDAAGREHSRLDEQRDVTALWRAPKLLLLGSAKGSLTAVPLARLEPRPFQMAPGFEQLPRAGVTRIQQGPGWTVLAGFADGTVGLWDLRTGRRLESFRLHGPIAHLRLTDRLLVAASELGDHRVFDVSAFSMPYCELLRQVWKDVPVLWEGGGPVRAAPPADHPCAR